MIKIKTILTSIGYFFIFSLIPIICVLIISLIYIILNKINISLPQVSLYLVEIISCVIIVVVLFFVEKAKINSFAKQVKLNKITIPCAIPFVFFGLSV